ncbi:hypothetical protein SAMN04488535_1114 [Corynebacterium mycetoides]|uniref:Membrane domain of glycerophosphoryl diester phosphodiesterase n=1 Tax=Corynebacterium mycetoides TaxID=38302 RepID=A0A1G9NPU1_9CORY|nr:hypothetical protein [Corynebacterium mycetoides]SDL88371.1 hypothetical protein SAMN04488535_1114 [Corynebacterium mycetoides]
MTPNTPWEVVDPIGFSFKRVFSRTWHVWIGVTLLFALCTVALTLAVLAPRGYLVFEEDVPALTSTDITVLVLSYIAFFALAIYFSALFFNAALRETRGEEQTWATVFRGVPVGRMTLAVVVLFGIMLAFCAIFGVVSFLAATVGPWLQTVVVIAAIVVFIPVFLVVTFVQFYILEGNGVGVSLGRARQDVLASFWKVFGSYVLLNIVCYAIVFATLGLGLLVYVPLLSLGTAYIYRQISGGAGAVA